MFKGMLSIYSCNGYIIKSQSINEKDMHAQKKSSF